MDKLKNRGGRPPGREFPVGRNIRLTEEDAASLTHLAERLGVTEADVLRRGLRELARREAARERRRAAQEETG